MVRVRFTEEALSDILYRSDPTVPEDSDLNKRKTGSRYEAMAADYLTQHGVEILERNYRIRTGEIDLIGKDGSYLVFFEVKYRRNAGMGEPLLAVDYRKRQQILFTARHYLYEHRCRADQPVRFDCVGITGGSTEWIRNAFCG